MRCFIFLRKKVKLCKKTIYREYETSPEKRKERAIQEISRRFHDKMTVEDKYKVIFDWCINYFNYAYSGLNYAYAEQEINKEAEKRLVKYYRNYCRNTNLQCNLLGLETRRKFLEYSKNNRL